jgi:opacity protein-like surface antigen
VNARTDSDLETAFATFSQQHVGAVLVGPSNFYNRRTEQVGAGVETRLWGGWSTKLEYLYANLGSTDRAFTRTNGLGDFATLTSNHSVSDHMVRFGLNYRFWQ